MVNSFSFAEVNYIFILVEVIFKQIFKFFSFIQVATFILQKILLDETGLTYICQTYERFSHVAMILVSTSYWLMTSVIAINSGYKVIRVVPNLPFTYMPHFSCICSILYSKINFGLTFISRIVYLSELFHPMICIVEIHQNLNKLDPLYCGCT